MWPLINGLGIFEIFLSHLFVFFFLTRMLRVPTTRPGLYYHEIPIPNLCTCELAIALAIYPRKRLRRWDIRGFWW